MSDTTLFRGGPIHTGAGGPVEALLVRDGRVAAAGTLARCRDAATAAPREIDLEGRALLPGFVDPHVHVLLTGYAVAAADLSGARSVAEIVEALRAQARRNPDAAVISGYGYDQSKLDERRHPSRYDLDRVDDPRPVHIQHASGHGYAVNSAALRRCGITAGTPTPPGGRIDRSPSGEPLGTLFDAACDLLTGPDGVKTGNHGPNFHLPLTPQEERQLFDLGQRAMLRAGITTICDAQVTSREMAAYLSARDEDRLRLRVHMLALSSTLEHLEALGLGAPLGDDRLRLHGVKLYADGSVIARTAHLGGRGCCGEPVPDGYLYHDPHELQELIVAAHRLGLRAATHAQGEYPIGLVLDAVERARAERPRPGLVHRIEHCGFPSDQQIERMARLDVVPVPQPMQVHLYGDSLMGDYGDYGARFYPAGSFHRAGLPVVLSSDAPVTMPNPVEAAWAATSRQTLGGALAEASGGPGFAVPHRVALAGTTSAPAALLGRRDIGRLTPGAAADLVLLDADPTTAELGGLPGISVQQTWIAGSPVWTA
ncbi:amidohydrolase [Saccharopolyspora rosea]|uniref:amidohydrolase n=1 Tax=Saccharopolyspora rosea TaxID=524884 RepID=UPI0021D9EC55|nr:amidohydrolase [Saccharopolyspora rosea]